MNPILIVVVKNKMVVYFLGKDRKCYQYCNTEYQVNIIKKNFLGTIEHNKVNYFSWNDKNPYSNR